MGDFRLWVTRLFLLRSAAQARADYLALSPIQQAKWKLFYQVGMTSASIAFLIDIICLIVLYFYHELNIILALSTWLILTIVSTIWFYGEYRKAVFLIENPPPHVPTFREKLEARLREHIIKNKYVVPTATQWSLIAQTAEEIWVLGHSTSAPSLLADGPFEADDYRHAEYQTLAAGWARRDEHVFEAIVQSMTGYIKHLEPLVPAPFSKPLEPTASMIFDMVHPFRAEHLVELGLCQRIPYQYNQNVYHTSVAGQRYADHPQEDRVPPEERVAVYFRDMPFRNLFQVSVPHQPYKEEQRLEHMWLIANSGHGKTQTIQHLIAHDLPKVQAGKCSLVVIDSQAKMIEQISTLKQFAPGQPMHDRLIIVDPKNITPPGINLFRLKQDDIYELLKLFNVVFGDFLESGMVANQQTLFENCVLLLRLMPNSHIGDLYDLLRAKDLTQYQNAMRGLSKEERRFFKEDFFSLGVDGYEGNKKQVIKRLNTLMRISVFKQMLATPQNTLDLFEQLEKGKVILVNTEGLGDGTTLLGRFFLALIGNVMRRRQKLNNPMPCYVYVDECDQYVKSDPTTIDLLARARKTNVGLVFAHRWLEELGTGVPKALESICSTIFAGGLRAGDAAHMARVMDTSPELLKRPEKMLYTVHVRGQPITTIKVPMRTMEQMDKMTREEYELLKEKIAADYGAKGHVDLGDIEEPKEYK